MSEKSISIIVMRDRGKSFSLRFSPNTFKVFLSVLVIVPVLLAGSIWFGLAIYNKYVSVLEESAALKNTIEQNRQTVTRLANLEKFLQKYSPSMLGLLVPSESVDMNDLPVIDGDKDALMSELAANLAGSPMSFDIMGGGDLKENSIDPKQNSVAKDSSENQTEKINTAAGGEKKIEKGNVEDVIESQNSRAQQEKNSQSAVQTGNVSEDGAALKKVNAGYIEIENFSAKVAAKNVHITYKLINVGKKVPLQGEQRYYLCSEINGKIVWQELKNPTDDSFRIKKLKHVKSTASIMGLEIGKKAQFAVEVLIGEEVVFRELYPLSH